jgi:ferritin-like protein
MSDKQQDIQPEVLAVDKPDLPVEQEHHKDETTTEGLEETGSTASKKVRTLHSRKKSAKSRLTKARNQLADLVDKKDIGLGNLPTKTEIRKAVFKVESEYNIIIKLIYSLKEIIALEHGEEHTDIDDILEALDNEVEELTVIVDTAVKRATEHIQQRLELGEEKSDTASSLSKNNSNDDQSSVLSIQSSLASKRRKEAEESKERRFALEKEQQQEEEELQRRVAALQLSKQRTEEA